MDSNAIKQKTKVGMLWNTLEKVLGQVISFGLNIILARLLTPHDYGTIGMLTIYLSFSNVFIDSGFSRALIQRQDRTENDFSTTLIFNVLMSCMIYVILFFASPAIAHFYKTPELVGLQRVFFLMIILNSLTVVQNAQLQIKVDFKRIAIINSLTSIISGVAGVIAAYNGLGPWALVIQSLARATINAFLYWIIGRWFPKTGFSWQSFKNLFGFGSKLLISGFLGTTVNCIYSLIIGKVYKPETLGYYTRANQFPDLTVGTLNSVLNTVTFPLLSSLQKDKEDFIATFKRLIKISSMIIFPSITGLAVLSKPIILVLLGEKWAFAAELMFWVSFANIFVASNVLNMNLLNAIGRSDLYLKIDLIKFPFMFAMMGICFPISIKAVAIGRAATAIIYYIINSYMPGKLYGFGPLKQFFCAWKYIIATVIMAVSVTILNTLIPSDAVTLFACVPAGVAVYMLVLTLLKDEEFFGLLKKIIRVFKRK